MKNHREPTGWTLLAASLLMILFSTSCSSPGEKKTDTPTAGSIRISADDSYKLLLDSEIYTFEALYKYAHIEVQYKPEADAINDLMNDSVPMIVVSRPLSDDQISYLKERQYIPRTVKIAYDAVALILNNNNPDSTLYYSAVKDIFRGRITQWSQINPKSKLGPVKVVFDHFKSGNPRYFKEKFGVDSFPPACVAAKSNEEVIRYVETSENAIGIISVNWISDRADSLSNRFLKRIRVAAVGIEGDDTPGAVFFKPYQAYIADQSYPFTREVYGINRQPYTGLAHGLLSFIAGEKGQLIVLHSGLVPAAMPVRIVELKH